VAALVLAGATKGRRQRALDAAAAAAAAAAVASVRVIADHYDEMRPGSHTRTPRCQRRVLVVMD